MHAVGVGGASARSFEMKRSSSPIQAVFTPLVHSCGWPGVLPASQARQHASSRVGFPDSRLGRRRARLHRSRRHVFVDREDPVRRLPRPRPSRPARRTPSCDMTRGYGTRPGAAQPRGTTLPGVPEGRARRSGVATPDLDRAPTGNLRETVDPDQLVRFHDGVTPRGASTPMLGVRQRLACVREAFRHHRSAKVHRYQWLFYLEHNLFHEAQRARRSMLDELRRSCQKWRLVLGTDH